MFCNLVTDYRRLAQATIEIDGRLGVWTHKNSWRIYMIFQNLDAYSLFI